ncbi:endothelin-converting enzyme 1-like [Cloeon dipterum]|uniref:endothelin-converting enzyme 1-like n=1 Tax=Cloeon dipterum TaxID=197152 RepID=UPI00321FE35F
MAAAKPHDMNGGSEMDPCLMLDGHRKAKFAEDGNSVDVDTPKGIARKSALHRAETYLREKTELNRRQLIFVLATVFALFLLLIVVIVLAACWPRSTHAKDFPVCRLPACLQASAQMLHMMNESVSPCHDIRSFSCGAWLNDHPLPSTRSIWNQNKQLEFATRQRIRELINTMPHENRITSVSWKVKHFYESCMSLDNLEADKAQPLRKTITQLGGWHVLRDFDMLSWDFPRVLEILHKDYGVSPFFKISVVVDARDPSQNIIQVSPSGLGLPDRSYYYRGTNNPVVIAYKRYLKDMVQLLGATGPDASSFAEEMFHFEKRIAEITPSLDELQDPATTYNRITLEALKSHAQSIPLLQILNAMFPKKNIAESTEILVVSRQYLGTISRIISTTDRSALNNYVLWTFASAYLPYLSQEYTEIVNEYIKGLTGLSEPVPRWEICVSTLQKFMGLAVAAMYQKAESDTEQKRKIVTEMFDDLRGVISEEVSASNWMPEELKDHVFQKVATMGIQVGFPQFMLENSYLENYYYDFYIHKKDFFTNIKYGVVFIRRDDALRRYKVPSEENRWSDSLIGSDVVYEPTANRIIVPLSLLQPPFFQGYLSRAMLYGTLGVRLSSAIVASTTLYGGVLADSQGRLLLPETPSMNIDGSSMPSSIHAQAKAAARRAQLCLVHSLASTESETDRIRVNRTAHQVNTNINAVSLSYRTMMRTSKVLPHVHQPALETYEDDALFFISYTQMTCSQAAPQQQDMDEVVNYQLDDVFLLRLTMREQQAFSKAFDCSRESLLYSRTSCVKY